MDIIMFIVSLIYIIHITVYIWTGGASIKIGIISIILLVTAASLFIMSNIDLTQDMICSAHPTIEQCIEKELDNK